MSSGRLHLISPWCIQIPPDSIVMNASSDGHKEVPDGMGERDDPITLEEDHA